MYTLLDVEVNTECGALNPAWGARYVNNELNPALGARYVNNVSKPRLGGQVCKQWL